MSKWTEAFSLFIGFIKNNGTNLDPRVHSSEYDVKKFQDIFGD